MDNATPYGESWQDILASPQASEPEPAEPPPGRSRSMLKGAALVLAGLVVGTVAVTAAQAATRDAGTTAAAPAVLSTTDDPPAFDGGRGFGRGGFDGEQRLSGTLTAVGADSVTVRTSEGTATYAVLGVTDIRRDGQEVALSSLRAGDAVLVHVLPTSSGLVAERILAASTSDPAAVTGTGRAT
jgi:hypothetical protein